MWGYALCGGNAGVMERSQQFFDKSRPRAKRRHGHTPGRRAVMAPDNFTYESADGRQLAGYRWAAHDGQTSTRALSCSSTEWVSTSADTTMSPMR